MDTKSWQVFVAVFLGVFTGLFGALTFTPALGPWWSLAWAGGALGGGILAYILYNPFQVWRSIGTVLKNEWSRMTTPAVRERWSLVRRYTLSTALDTFFIAWWAVAFLLIYLVEEEMRKGIFNNPMWAFGCACFVVGVFWIMSFLMLISSIEARISNVQRLVAFEWRRTQLMDDLRQELDRDKYMFVKASPFALAFYWLPRGLYVGIRYGIPAVWRALPLVCEILRRVTWKSYVLIHSQARLICFTDAAASVALFYFFESIPIAVLAAVVGGLWGVVNYKLVAPYVCHVQPV